MLRQDFIIVINFSSNIHTSLHKVHIIYYHTAKHYCCVAGVATWDRCVDCLFVEREVQLRLKKV